MVECRLFETRAQELFFEGLVRGTTHLGIGQEAVAAGFAAAMRADDYTFCTYRGHNHTLARGVPMAPIFAELFGRDYGLINWFLHLFGVHHTNWTNGTRLQSQVAISAIVTWRWTGYNALIYLAAMQSIPTELYEAAAIDGGNRWQQFRNVTIPALRPTILFTIVLSTIGAMQMFAEPYLFAGDGTTNAGGSHQYQTLALFMYQQGWTNFHLGQAAATAWTMLFIIVVLVCINAALARGRTRRGWVGAR
jgi:cellobiose transport system permease protein